MCVYIIYIYICYTDIYIYIYVLCMYVCIYIYIYNMDVRLADLAPDTITYHAAIAACGEGRN